MALKGDLTPGTAVPHPIRVASLLPLSSGGVGSGNGMRDADWRQLFIPGMSVCDAFLWMSERCQDPKRESPCVGRRSGTALCRSAKCLSEPTGEFSLLLGECRCDDALAIGARW